MMIDHYLLQKKNSIKVYILSYLTFGVL